MTLQSARLLAVVSLAGCVAEPEITEALPGAGPDFEPIPAIYNGSAPSQPYHDTVVSLHQRVGSSVYTSPFCTGTLVSPDVVVTAAHCLDTSGGGPNFKTLAPSGLAIYVGDEPAVDLLAHVYGVSETVIYPTYDRRRLRNDIALVRLSSPIVEPVTPAPYLDAGNPFAASDVGRALDFVGFGQTETGTSGVKLRVLGTLGGLGCAVAGCSNGGDKATQISYSQPLSAGGPCFGDSGGPAFVDRNGVAMLGGVTSYGDSQCTIYGVSTRVDAFADWIDAFVGTGGGDGGGGSTGGDGGGSTGGDGGGGSTDTCGDAVCDLDESCDGRSGTTACPTDCDGVTGGKPSLRYCFIGDTCQGPGCP